MRQLTSAEARLSDALGRFPPSLRRIPLKANQNMLAPRGTDIDEKISFARQAYNDAAVAYNTATRSFSGESRCQHFSFWAGGAELETVAEKARQAILRMILSIRRTGLGGARQRHSGLDRDRCRWGSPVSAFAKIGGEAPRFCWNPRSKTIRSAVFISAPVRG
jgi:hypothetical protein